MLNLDEMRTHIAKGSSRVKFSLSPEAHDKLRAAARYTGVSMSEIVETLVHGYVPDLRDAARDASTPWSKAELKP